MVFIHEFIDVEETLNSHTQELDVERTNVTVDGLPEVMIRIENEVCAICYETFSTGEPLKQLPCKHLFHSNCILLWFCLRMSCPFWRDEPQTRSK